MKQVWEGTFFNEGLDKIFEKSDAYGLWEFIRRGLPKSMQESIRLIGKFFGRARLGCL